MTDQDTAALAPPSLLRLMVHQNLYLPVIVLLLALALSFAPDPTSPTAKGISPRVLALPLAIAGLLAMVLAILRALSQRRAIASGIKISCTVQGHEDGTGTHGLHGFALRGLTAMAARDAASCGGHGGYRLWASRRRFFWTRVTADNGGKATCRTPTKSC